ncbi:hypothetical protein OIU77_022930 [Salix suchowensis]|uniref:Translation initiation factor 2 n=1 Tax=Salix suchowensis TaxID=1278906 RepID=A0ABQ9C214_9ROSI|nr:hypothetical protein OIU77_022930 [Salix suchowensis]
MACRAAGKRGIDVGLKRVLTSTSLGHAVGLTSRTSLGGASARYIPESSSSSFLQGSGHHTTLESPIRCFHASRELWARRKNDDQGVGLKTQKKGKFAKRIKKPPVDAPYVPPKLKRISKSLQDKTIDIFEGMTIVELAKRTGQSVISLQELLVNLGEKVVSEFDPLKIDVAELVVMEAGANVRRLHSNEGSEILPRPVVVTVMGHVDHGKTSLLDALRQTSVAAKEAGGITQHLGAFVVSMPSGAAITFLDTPGHAPSANPERVKLQLASEGFLLEEMGGDIQVVEVSAITKTGLDNLEEAILLQAEMMELKARVDGHAQAYVVEAKLDKGRGPLATAIVKAGTLVCGQHVVVGSEWGRIRVIRDMSGKLTERARPAMPVVIEGLKGLPMAGDDVTVVETEERARMLSAGRRRKYEKDRLRQIMEQRTKTNEPSEDDSVVPERTEMPLIVKADVQGTVQAVTDALRTLNSPQVFVNVVHVGVGPISQSDVDLAQACGAYIVGFNVKSPPSSISQAATKAGTKIMQHQVIYHLLDEVGNLVVDKAPGTLETQVAGAAEVLNIFELKGRSKSAGGDIKIAGCRVMDGHFSKSSSMRLLRSGEEVFEGPCTSLKINKHDVELVEKGNECGLVILGCNDFQIGDVIQCLEQVVRKPKLIISDNGIARIECY